MWGLDPPTATRLLSSVLQGGDNGKGFATLKAVLRCAAVMIALYPGSFDPITLGHLDIIERACRLFDQVIVAVLKNPNKTPLFTPQQRVRQISQATHHLPNIQVDTFIGLTITYARQHQAQVLIRGLRVLSDFDVELQMAHTNKMLAPELETVFLATSSHHSFLSSSLVKEVARFGGSVEHLVPAQVLVDLHQCFPSVPPHQSPLS